MTLSARGVIKGKRIQLDKLTGLPDGTRVALQIQTRRLSREEAGKRIDELCGSCAVDPSFAAAVEEAIRERAHHLPREVSFDVAS